MEPVYDLRSDTVTRPTPEMKRAMIEAPLGDDVLGDDPTVKRLEAMIAEITGKERGLFFPSGTQANQTAIQVHAGRGHEVLLERRSHIFNYEAGAPAALSGVQLHPVDTIDGALRPADLEGRVRPLNEHFPQTRLVCLENTHNGHGGRIYPIADMEAISRWARDRGLAVHLDGARLFNAVVASGVAPERWAACADTVSICLSKGLGAPVGSLLCGGRDFIKATRRWRKMLGGGMRQAGVIAAAGIVALETMVERLADDHEHARLLAQGLAQVPGFRIDPDAVQTNIVISDVPDAISLTRKLREAGLLTTIYGPTRLRMVTHYGIERTDIEEALVRVRRVAEAAA